ncbi:hypothetical protein D9756_001838 [Leucocoprinus leucothites]|uniref:NACHT domain-containing protein n=1 Tax=Leucocoprinus leucothites TaxID=201217 RepID=A0A8H5G3S1_9AGAR|nr:hypothetical protein D9756_001838 [Leucoagaricus leucothites]
MSLQSSGKPEQAGGMFHSAHHFTLENPILIEQRIINGGIENPLKELMTHAIHGAEVDSSERDPPPRCHPGTRMSILQEARRFFQDPKSPENIFWLCGSAGVGKSAIVQTLAEGLKDLDDAMNYSFGAAIFFSRPNQRDNPRLVFPTIAYQLAVRYPFYRQYIAAELSDDPMLLDKSVSEQFKRLITQPFADQGLCYESKSLVIMLDGLDECNGEQEQANIISLITQFILRNPNVRLLWLISSRPEPHICDVFSRINVLSLYHRENVPINSNESCKDVERYLRKAFMEIYQRYSDCFSENTRWPTESQFLTLCAAATGLFAFAAAVVRFIGDAEYGNPILQMNGVLSAIEKRSSEQDSLRINPFASLDAVYIRILSSIPEVLLPTTVRILQQLICMPHSRFVDLANFLGLAQHEVYSALRGLHSLLSIPPPYLAHDEKITTYHASFTDFLRDSVRSGQFCIKISAMVEDHVSCSLRILVQTTLGHTDLNNIALSWPAERANLELVRSRLLTHAMKSLAISFFSAPEEVQQQCLSTIIKSLIEINVLEIASVAAPRFFLSFLKGILTFAHSRGSLEYGLTKLTSVDELDRSAIDTGKLAYVHCRDSGPEGFASMGSRGFMLRTISRECWKTSGDGKPFAAYNKATTEILQKASMHKVLGDLDYLRMHTPSMKVIIWGTGEKRVIMLQHELHSNTDLVKQEWLYVVAYPGRTD